LLLHHLCHRLGQACLVGSGVERLAILLGTQEDLQLRRPDQAADMGGENAFAAALHKAGWLLGDDGLERDDFIFESSSRSNLFVEHDLFRKPMSTFRDHALADRATGRQPRNRSGAACPQCPRAAGFRPSKERVSGLRSLRRQASAGSRRGHDVHEVPPGPPSIAPLRDAILRGGEPPPSQIVARLPAYRWCVVGTVCVGAFMGQVDSSIAQMLLPRLEHAFDARLSTVSWVAVAYLLTMAAFLPIFGR